jgi:aflatoxin B1 aldehyde reductase
VQIFYRCQQLGYVAPSVYQGKYNPLCRGAEAELLPALRALGIAFYAYSPLAGGLSHGRICH